ncbi:14029_t:CDS:2 [Funneliformis geosporum]|uniref:14322_t:CDS:1 n=1 Tax=Funneliformis geosporum TaxID=1117311 RepID=A0A9W4SJY0_9GLOM|nr:14029_t:CDS:2 [Funneliformis geosporum]CAI2172247.1 14322_t:CDS:2 [Funneliformis geosporum]
MVRYPKPKNSSHKTCIITIVIIIVAKGLFAEIHNTISMIGSSEEVVFVTIRNLFSCGKVLINIGIRRYGGTSIPPKNNTSWLH